MDVVNISIDSPLPVYFPLKKYGYSLIKVLNNENRWQTKLVCSILDSYLRHYVSTTYAKQNEYLRLLETTAYLKCNNKLSPKIVNIYPNDKTVVCDYIGEFLTDYLLNNSANISLIVTSALNYLRDINSIIDLCIFKGTMV